jgi:hypothetical protein
LRKDLELFPLAECACCYGMVNAVHAGCSCCYGTCYARRMRLLPWHLLCTPNAPAMCASSPGQVQTQVYRARFEKNALFWKKCSPPRRVTHQPTPNPHPVLDHPTGAVVICFRHPRLKRCHLLEKC